MSQRRAEPIAPGPGQESVWDYPRPPRLEPSARRVRVEFGGVTIVDTAEAWRVLETSHPPVYYVPRSAITAEHLVRTNRRSFCEFKGNASYYTVRAGGQTASDAAWTYLDPTPAFAALADHVAFYPGRMDACYLDDEPVRAQPGDFYGGWITDEIVGPFKGDPGTMGW